MTTCLLTGGTGFIGSHAITGLTKRGWQVHVLARNPSRVPPSVHAHNDDGSTQSISNALADSNATVVIHLAACYIKDHSGEDIPRLIAGNIAFGTQMLEAMCSSHCRRLVTLGTSWQHVGVPDDTYRPASLYAATKQAFEDIARWYAMARNLRITSLHLGDTYGPGDPRPKIFGLLARAAATGEPIDLTPGLQELDPLHVDDAVTALDIAARRDQPGFSVFRASPGKPVTLRRLVELWCTSTGLNPTLRWGSRQYRSDEVMTSWQGGVPLPGWSAAVRLEDGLRSLIHQDAHA